MVQTQCGGFTCGVCKKSYGRPYWSRSELHRHNKRGTVLVCKHCRLIGYNGQDRSSYRCTTCAGFFGSGFFAPDAGLKQFAKRECLKAERLCCRTCRLQHLPCRACGCFFPMEHWAPEEHKRLRRARAVVVCHECRKCNGGQPFQSTGDAHCAVTTPVSSEQALK